MNLAVLRHGRSLHGIHMVVLFTAAMAIAVGLMLQVIHTLDFLSDTIGPAGPPVAGMRWAPTEVYLAVLFPVLVTWPTLLRDLPLRHRVAEHERSLPIAYGDLLATRATAVFLAWALPVITCMLLWLPVASKEGILDAIISSSATLLAAGALFAALCFRWRPRSPTLPIIEVVGLVACGIAVVALPAWLNAPWIGLLYAAVGGSLFRGIRSAAGDAIPDTALKPAARSHGQADQDRGQGLRLPPLARVLLRSTLLSRHGLVLLLVPFYLFITPRTNATFLMLAAYFVWQYSQLALNVLNGVGSLPLSRSRVLPYVVLPPLVALLVGIAIEPPHPERLYSWDPVSERVRLTDDDVHRIGEEGDYPMHVRVPARLWRVSMSRTPVEITAPWGESTTAKPHSFVLRFPPSVYNPYHVAPDNSLRFLCWQLSRALEQTSGEVHPPAELERELVALYQEDWDDPEVPATVEDLFLYGFYEEYPPESRTALSRPAPDRSWFLLAMGISLWICLMTFVLRPNIPAGTREARRWMVFRYVIGGAVASVIGVWVFIIGLKDRALAPVWQAWLHRSLDSLVGSSTLAWVLLNAVLLAGGYAWLNHRMNRIEIPPAPKVGWQKKTLSVY